MGLVIFEVPYTADGLPSSAKPMPPDEVGISLGELAWASVTLGQPGRSSVFSGPDAAMGLDWRLCMVLCSLVPAAGGGMLVMSDAFRQSDANEKGAVSYVLGGVSARLFAEHAFGAEALVHYDAYLRSRSITPKGSRPDFIGLSAVGETLIVEAKGRSATARPDLMNAAMRRAAKGRAGRHAGAIAWGHASHWTSTGQWRAAMRFAPPDASGEAPSQPVDRDVLRSCYYRPIVDAMRIRGAVKDPADLPAAWTSTHFAEMDIEISMRASRFRAYGGVDKLATGYWLSNLLGREPGWQMFTRDSPSAYVGSDGIAVRLGPSWRQRFAIPS